MNPAIQSTTPFLMEGGAVCWRGLFASAGLDALALEQARLNSGASSIRVAWRHRNAETEALYRDMEATPVTRGWRKALVVWRQGRNFVDRQ